MTTTDELRDLDRQWAELAGWTYEEKGWRDPDGDFTYYTKRFSWRPDHCFGPGGPWEWLRMNGYVELSVTHDRIALCDWASTNNSRHAAYQSPTEFEAITRCAIEARKKLEGGKR